MNEMKEEDASYEKKKTDDSNVNEALIDKETYIDLCTDQPSLFPMQTLISCALLKESNISNALPSFVNIKLVYDPYIRILNAVYFIFKKYYLLQSFCWTNRRLLTVVKLTVQCN